mgnify:CR=1 FL=1
MLLDLGSAVLSLEVALASLDPAERAHVRVAQAPLVEGTIVAAVLVTLVNLVVDILYGFLDPRIRVQ